VIRTRSAFGFGSVRRPCQIAPLSISDATPRENAIGGPGVPSGAWRMAALGVDRASSF
jgi:hypothetical protein